MPIYEYICKNCAAQFEFFQKISEKPKTRCPNCSGKLEKSLSLSSFQLKGDGWYITDYARKDTASNEKKKTKSEVSDSKQEAKVSQTKDSSATTSNAEGTAS